MKIKRYERQVYDMRNGPVEIANLVEILDYKPHEQRLIVLVEVDDLLCNESVTLDEIAATEAADSVFYCVGEKSDGSRCSREVDQLGDRCWQHQEEDNE